MEEPSPLNRILDTTDLQQFLDLHQAQAEILHLPVETPTVEAAARAVGTRPQSIVKSLLFLVDGRPVLVIACGPQRVAASAVAQHFGLSPKRVRLAGPQTVLEATGYPIGALPPFGHRRPLPTLLDRHVLEHDQVFAGGGSFTSLVRLAPGELLRLTGAQTLDLQPHADVPHE